MPNVHVRTHDWTNKDIVDGIRDGRLQVGLIVTPAKASALRDVRYEELFHEHVCVMVAPQHRFARRRAIPIVEVAAEPLIGLTREDYPNYYDLLSIIFSKVKQKPRVVEEHDSFSGIISAVEAGTGVAIGVDPFGRSFGNRVKLLHISPEPKPISIGIAANKRPTQPSCGEILAVRQRSCVKKIDRDCLTALKCSCASCRDGMVLIAATTADTDCAYYFALAFQRDAASENHDLAIV